jgi:hypothetical protein
MPLPTILHFTDAFIRVFMGWKMQKPSWTSIFIFLLKFV